MTDPMTPQRDVPRDAADILAERDERFRPQLESIGRAIGYGRSCQILGELWDDMLEREWGLPKGRGKIERRHDIEKLEAVIRDREIDERYYGFPPQDAAPTAVPAAPAMDLSKPCQLLTATKGNVPTLCERCRNPHNACDYGKPAAPAPDADVEDWRDTAHNGTEGAIAHALLAAANAYAAQAREIARLCDQMRQECDDADDLCEALGLRSDLYRTEGGSLNVPRIKAALRERDAAARADAERYRFLRMSPTQLGWDADYRPDEVDAAIDAARAAMGDGNG